MKNPCKVLLALLTLALALTGLPACSAGQETGLAMMPLGQMPAQVQSAPATVREAYQFAAANPEVMQGIPCYCGCGSVGHTSSYSCYVSGADASGITFDTHALGCSLCVDITQDTMRLLKEGKTVPEIKAYVDATYGKYGTSNMP
jgi:hypothetical protein